MDLYQSTIYYQEAVQSNNVTPQVPFIQAQHPQLPQALLRGLVF